MIFTETKLKGAYVIRPEPIEDERGFFARVFCQNEFKAHNIDFNVVQCNISHNKESGTLRGMHYQVAPYQEAKLIYCTSGIIHDVIIDLRPDSATFHSWFDMILSPDGKMLYMPQGFAHGYETLSANTTVFYLVSEYYHAEYERTIRWDDPKIGIKWSSLVKIISGKDSNARYL